MISNSLTRSSTSNSQNIILEKFIDNLPDEIFWSIMTFMKISEILSFRLVQKQFFGITKNENFWKEIYIRFSTHRNSEILKNSGFGKKFRIQKPIWCKSWKKLNILYDYVKNIRILQKYEKYLQVLPTIHSNDNEKKVDNNITCVIVGSRDVGKTSLLERLRYNKFIEGMNTNFGLSVTSIVLKYPMLKYPIKNMLPVKMSLYCGSFNTIENDHQSILQAGYRRKRKNFSKVFMEQKVKKNPKGVGGFIRNYDSKSPKNPILNYCDIILLCFDLSNMLSFEYLKELIPYFKLKKVILVGCKLDLRKTDNQNNYPHLDKNNKDKDPHQIVPIIDIVNFLNQLSFFHYKDLDYIEVSSKDNINIFPLFNIVTRKCLKDNVYQK